MKSKTFWISFHVKTGYFVSVFAISVMLILPSWANDPIFRPAVFTDSIRRGTTVEFVDIDNDQDIDLFVGRNNGGGIAFYRNVAMPGKEPVLIPDGGLEPFGLLDIERAFSNAPAFTDIDNDGDLDAFVGYGDPSNTGVQIVFYRNVAAPGATEPEYLLETRVNPFGLDAESFEYQIAFLDIDADGDQDVFIGLGFGEIVFYRNQASPGGVAQFVQEGGETPFGLSSVGRNLAPYFIDIDGDSDVDAFLGTSEGRISFFRNVAAAQSEPEFVLESEESPFGLPGPEVMGLDTAFDPVFIDIDDDGDFDALIGQGDRSGIGLFRNIAGAIGDPVFVQESSFSAFGLTTNRTQDPYFVDLEGDGDLDAITGGLQEIAIYRNDAGNQPLENPRYTLELRSDRLFGLPLQNFPDIPFLMDMDGDGDLDAIQSFGLGPSGMEAGYYFYENLNGPTPRPQFSNSIPVPISGLQGVQSGLLPVFVDIDADGDLDVFVKSRQVSGPRPLRFFRNIAASGMSYVEEGGSSPFGLDPNGDASPPVFGDLDGDGDLDALTGSRSGQFHFFRNTAGPGVEPVFVSEGGEIPFGLYTVNLHSNPFLVDIDSDGDLDVFFGVFTRGTEFMRNVLNIQPSFDIGPDQFSLDNSPEQRVFNFISNVNDGDGGVDQAVSFIVTNDRNELFNQQPRITPTGTLRYTPIDGATGTATIQVVMQDDGGTENGGIDTSEIQTFNITIKDDQVTLANVNNSGSGSLRDLVENAIDGQTFNFDNTMAEQTISLSEPMTITQDITINGVNPDHSMITGNGSSGVFVINSSARVTLNNLQIRNANDRAGSAINVTNQAAEVTINRSRFVENFASFNGGVIDNQGGRVVINASSFIANTTTGNGGAVSNHVGGELIINHSSFSNNQSSGDGGAIANVNGSLLIQSSSIANNSALNFAGGIANGSGSSTAMRNTIVAGNSTNSRNARDIGNNGSTTSIQSQGGNLIGIVEPAGAGNSMGIFTHPQDQSGTLQQPLDPLLEETAAGLLVLQTGSPAIDAGLSGFDEQGALPCGFVDIRGLGRPQDGNGDGQFECDSGAYELQGGLDIGAPQSAVYFDPARNGEGQVIELLSNNRAVISEFTFDTQGRQLWWTALGQRVGNSVVFNNVSRGQGGVWGSAFDPSRITRTNIGGMAVVFADCESVEQPGRVIFQGNGQDGLGNLMNAASRLTTAVECDGQVTNPLSERSGSYFSPSRNGEGLQYTELNNGGAVMVFYGYAPDGNLFWTTSGATTVDGNVVTAQMFYPAETTVFGSGFNPDDISREPFGELTLTFDSDNNVQIDIQPVITGFEPVSYTAQRLTSPIGFDE